MIKPCHPHMQQKTSAWPPDAFREHLPRPAMIGQAEERNGLKNKAMGERVYGLDWEPSPLDSELALRDKPCLSSNFYPRV